MIENQLFEALFDVFPFGVYVTDVETYEVCYVNRSFKEAHGDSVGKTCYEAIYKEDSPCYYCKIPQLLNEKRTPNNKTLIFERFNEYNDRWYQHHEKTMCWPDGRVIKYSIEVDICELKEMQNRLAEAHAALALKNKELIEINTRDELTKIYNRSHLNQVLSEQLYKAQRYKTQFSIVIIDIDDFKLVNDSHGHLVGDQVLIEFSRLISQHIRQSDCFGRWGGEEFMIIVSHINSENETKMFVEKLCKVIAAQTFTSIGHCSASFGLAHYKNNDTGVELVKKADDALYFAKAQGKNQVRVHGEIDKNGKS